MLNATVKKEIINEVGRLGYEQQRRVLDFARALVITDQRASQARSFSPLLELSLLLILRKWNRPLRIAARR